MSLKMREVLTELNRNKGVLGSLITLKDGIPVEAILSEGVDLATLSAAVSEVGQTISKSEKLLGIGELQQAIIETSTSRLFIANVGFGYLAVIAQLDVNVGMIRLLVTEAQKDIQNIHFEEE